MSIICTVTIEIASETYTADVFVDGRVVISQDGIVVGRDGRWEGAIVDCAAPLGDAVYAGLDAALEAALDAAWSDLSVVTGDYSAGEEGLVEVEVEVKIGRARVPGVISVAGRDGIWGAWGDDASCWMSSGLLEVWQAQDAERRKVWASAILSAVSDSACSAVGGA